MGVPSSSQLGSGVNFLQEDFKRREKMHDARKIWINVDWCYLRHFFSRNPLKKTSMFSKEEGYIFVVKNVLRIYSQICMICNATFNVYNMCIVKDIIRETNVRIRY